MHALAWRIVGVGEGDGAEVDDVDTRADEALNRFLPPDIVPGVPRTHHVTGLVLSRDGELWLARTLAAIEAQVRPVDEVVGIDAGSSDDSAQILSEAFSTTVLVGPEAEGAGGDPVGGMARALAEPLRPRRRRRSKVSAKSSQCLSLWSRIRLMKRLSFVR